MTRQFNTNLNVIPAAACQVRTNPEGIESFSPVLAMQSPTLGNGDEIINREWVEWHDMAGAGDATPLGLGIIGGR